MIRFPQVIFACALTLFLCPPADAQITPGGVVNVASFAPVGLPNAQIARGSVFAVFGQNLAAEGLAQATSFPLPIELGGTTVEVEVSGVVSQCWLLFTTPGQVGVLLPSATPSGAGTLRLSHGGQTFTEPIEVTARSFGIFTQNSAGSGPASFQNFISPEEQPLNSLAVPATPGQVGTLWGTGLGPVEGPENERALPGALPVDLEIYVGGERVTEILYAGRSGCCAGIDQIVFALPQDLEGCWTPVTVVVDGVPSNYASVSIAKDGVLCRDEESFTEEELRFILEADRIRSGVIDFSRIDDILLPTGQRLLTEQATATFQSFTQPDFLRAQPPFETRAGSCSVRMFSANPSSVEIVPRVNLDAGASLTLSGPAGDRTMTLLRPGVYADTTLPDLSTDLNPYFGAAEYAVSIPGGSGVEAAAARATLVEPPDWTNRSSITQIDRTAGLTLTWENADPAAGHVFIFGVAGTQNRTGADVGAIFFCDVPPEAGSFTVPPHVLAGLPESGTLLGFPYGNLQVGTVGTPGRFTANGLDIGLVTWVVSQGLLGVPYR